MNIFVLEDTPEASAASTPDILVGKLLLESAQLLCTAVHYYASHLAPEIPYGIAHPHHPICRWVRDSDENYEYTVAYARALGNQHFMRFKTHHASTSVVLWCRDHQPTFASKERTPHKQCMPDHYKVVDDPVAAYRAWLQAKPYARNCKWSYPAYRPSWWAVQTKEDTE